MVTSIVRSRRSILQTLIFVVMTMLVITQANAVPSEQNPVQIESAESTAAKKPEAQAAAPAVATQTPAAPPAIKPTPVAANAKSAQCIACHGEKGNSTVTIWPKIAGQHQSYIYQQLVAFKQAERKDPSMFTVVQGLDSQDMADLAAFYAGQVAAPGTAKASMLALGQAIYRGGNLKNGVPACAACHGANGMGNELAKFPRLSGQHAEYTANQLRNYKKKVRTNDTNGIMQDIAMRLADEEIEAISSYVEGLH